MIANSLKMYMLLQVRGLMKVGDIAHELGVTPRMVKRYREELEDANISISSVLGRHGGYYLENYMNLQGLSITVEELSSLKNASEVIRNGNYYYASDFDTLTSKILNEKNNFDHVSYFSKGISTGSTAKDKDVWLDINKAIANKKKLKITYTAITPKQPTTVERIVHPYGLCDHKGATYFYGHCELRNECRTFKVCRIMSHEILKDKFVTNTGIDYRKKMNESFGMYNDKQVELKLKIHYPMSQIVKEKVYAENQKIEDIDDLTIYFEAKMRGYTEIKRWVMGMGSLVEVIKPVELKEAVQKEAKKVLNLYEKDNQLI